MVCWGGTLYVYYQDLLLGSSQFLLVQILGFNPDASILSILQLQDSGQKVAGEHFRALTRKKSGQMVDGDNVQWLGVGGLDRNGRLVKGGVDGIDGNGVVGVGGITRNVTNDRQGTFSVQQLAGDERRNLMCEVNAVDKDI